MLSALRSPETKPRRGGARRAVDLIRTALTRHRALALCVAMTVLPSIAAAADEAEVVVVASEIDGVGSRRPVVSGRVVFVSVPVFDGTSPGSGIAGFDLVSGRRFERLLPGGANDIRRSWTEVFFSTFGPSGGPDDALLWVCRGDGSADVLRWEDGQIASGVDRELDARGPWMVWLRDLTPVGGSRTTLDIMSISAGGAGGALFSAENGSYPPRIVDNKGGWLMIEADDPGTRLLRPAFVDGRRDSVLRIEAGDLDRQLFGFGADRTVWVPIPGPAVTVERFDLPDLTHGLTRTLITPYEDGVAWTRVEPLGSVFGELVALCDSAEFGIEPWLLSGGTGRLISDIHPGPAGSADPVFTPFIRDYVHVVAKLDDGTQGPGLWELGAFSAARPLTGAASGLIGLDPTPLANVRRHNALVVLASATRPGFGRELWRLRDGDSASPIDIQGGAGSSDPRALAALPNGLVFLARDETGRDSVWFSDSTPTGLRLLLPGRPPLPEPSTLIGVSAEGTVVVSGQDGGLATLWNLHPPAPYTWWGHADRDDDGFSDRAEIILGSDSCDHSRTPVGGRSAQGEWLNGRLTGLRVRHDSATRTSRVSARGFVGSPPAAVTGTRDVPWIFDLGISVAAVVRTDGRRRVQLPGLDVRFRESRRVTRFRIRSTGPAFGAPASLAEVASMGRGVIEPSVFADAWQSYLVRREVRLRTRSGGIDMALAGRSSRR